MDYSFAGPETLPAGWTSMRLVNQGREAHQITLLKLAQGKTLADFTAAMQAGGPPPAGLFTEEGGPNGINPGTEGTAVVNLEPGTYVLACFIPSPDGVPHVAKGMIKPITVSGTASAANEPRGTVTIEAVDFGFRVTPDVTAGTQMFRFNSGGTQAHEVELVRLAPGKTARDVIAFFEPPAPGAAPPSGPPPGDFLGGVAGIEKGKSAYFPAQMTPGNYALICFLPDVTDPQGTPHFAKGMISEFTVR